MPDETLDLQTLSQRMLKDYARAVRDLERADKYLNGIFAALHTSGLTQNIIRTDFMPANHWRLVEWYSKRLTTLEEQKEDTG